MALRLRYQTIEFDQTDMHLCTLRNRQEFCDQDGIAEALGISSSQWSLFGVVWPSGLVLAKHIDALDTTGKRILEVGCGIGLSSLLLNHKQADITATDYHPEVETFLKRNAALNQDAIIPFERADWTGQSATLGVFDLIIGSDLLYEDQHIAQLASFIEQHAKPTCEVIIVDPGRGRKTKVSKLLAEHNFSNTHTKPIETDYLDAPFKGHILTFTRKAS